ncbi:TonB family protein [Paraburkholderia susongensis]|nr:TonB family protein [Paraburkholderia susongensis]
MHPATGYRRAALVLGVVIAAHAALLALMLAVRDRTLERPVEPRTITAVLLSPEPEPPAPAAALPAPAAPAPATPPAARPAVRVKPVPPPRAHAPQVPRVPQVQRAPQEPPSVTTPAPAATAQSAAPSTPARAATAPATPAPAAPMAASAPAAQPAMPASSAPKNVSHVDCTIPKPDYPDISRRRGENGTAVVRFVVGLTGRVETVELQKSSGYARLDDAALAAAHASACQPYSENGVPVRAAYSQSFVFGLAD